MHAYKDKLVFLFDNCDFATQNLHLTYMFVLFHSQIVKHMQCLVCNFEKEYL